MLFLRGLLWLATLVWGLVFLARLFMYERRYDAAVSRASRDLIVEARNHMLGRTIIIGFVLIMGWALMELAT